MITKKQFTEVTHEAMRQGKKITFSTGKLAPHSDGAVVITYGDTQLLVTAVMKKNADPDKDFLPLAIEFRDSYYATGKIGGGRFNKREGRPSDETILYCRLIDRPLRPMFPKGMVNDVVITVTPLCLDLQNSPGELGIIGASTAIMLAGIPFAGPVGAARIGYADGQYIFNMTEAQATTSLLDLHAAWTANLINMVEAGGNECPIEIVSTAFDHLQTMIAEICAIQQEFINKCTISPKEITLNYPTQQQLDEMHTVVTDEEISTLFKKEKTDFDFTYAALERKLYDHFKPLTETKDSGRRGSTVNMGFFALVKKYIRKNIIEKGQRIDGRTVEQIRTIYCEHGTIPRAHGCGLFWRGDSQILSMLTLGSPGDAQMQDDMENTDVEKRFLHHYKMPPFSNNEAMMIRGANRREIGHGRLAEKALEPMIPSEESFPYTIRIVSEVLGSGGSTSMASVCGSTIALLDAGVQIKRPVSGIAMGLICGDDDQTILTDISGTEDFIGDMDFKLAGTTEGMTAIQMDIKIQGLTVAKIKEILVRAQTGRAEILDFMLQTIDKPSETLSPYAPLLLQFAVKPEQVREVIGPGGSVIQEIIRITGVKIDLNDDGTGVITAKEQEAGNRAMQMIKDVVRSPKPGDKVTGKITRVEKYGVFVELSKKKTGLVHVKQLGAGYIEDPATLFKVGDMMSVEVTGIDADGKIQLKKSA